MNNRHVSGVIGVLSLLAVGADADSMFRIGSTSTMFVALLLIIPSL